MNATKSMAAAALLALLPANPASSAEREPYAAPSGTCDGWPRLAIGMAKGFCAGLVAGPTRSDKSRPMLFPRELLQLDDGASCAQARTHAESKLAEVQLKLADLHRMETVLSELIHLCGSGRGKVRCPLIAAMERQSPPLQI